MIWASRHYVYGIRQIQEMAWLWTGDKSSWWRHQMETFSAYWLFVRGIIRSPVKSPDKVQWRGALKFSLISSQASDWVSNRDAGDFRRHRAVYDVTVMITLYNDYPVHFAYTCVTMTQVSTCCQNYGALSWDRVFVFKSTRYFDTTNTHNPLKLKRIILQQTYTYFPSPDYYRNWFTWMEIYITRASIC